MMEENKRWWGREIERKWETTKRLFERNNTKSAKEFFVFEIFVVSTMKKTTLDLDYGQNTEKLKTMEKSVHQYR